MQKQILQVVKFQEAFGIKGPEQPKMLKKTRARLRQILLEEEVKELSEAKNLLDVADAICDIMFITLGTAHEYGLTDRLEMLFDEVTRSNMSKIDNVTGKAIFREDGKILKPETFSEPKLCPIIERNFKLYKDSEVMKEIAAVEKKLTENRIKHKIKSKLNFVDRSLFWISDKIETYLRKQVEVTFPQTIDGDIIVKVYDEQHTINS
jgi:predicted HAD superfamily Cof-like phosphohydrolase